MLLCQLHIRVRDVRRLRNGKKYFNPLSPLITNKGEKGIFDTTNKISYKTFKY